jgi:hypothetical protein
MDDLAEALLQQQQSEQQQPGRQGTRRRRRLSPISSSGSVGLGVGVFDMLMLAIKIVLSCQVLTG